MDKESKTKAVIKTVITVAVVAVVAIVAFAGAARTAIKDGTLTSKATLAGSTSVKLSDITDVELRESFDAGSRSFGIGTSRVSGGSYTNSEFGSYHLYKNNAVAVCVVVRYSGGVLVFNAPTEQETRQLYEELTRS